MNQQELKEINRLKQENEQFGFYFDKLEEEQRQMVSRLSHDLRNVLTLLISSFQLMESKHEEVKNFMYWEESMVDVRYMRKFLETLSVYNKAGILNLQSIHLTDLLEDAKKKVVMSPEYQHSVPVVIKTALSDDQMEADGIKLLYGLEAIVKNACEAAGEEGKVEIMLSENKERYELLIQNTGESMTKEEKEHVFEPFYTGKQNHVGLGASICYKTVVAHNGEIYIQNGVTEGTSVRIILPKTQEIGEKTWDL